MRYGVKGDMIYEVIEEDSELPKVIDQYGQERYSMSPPPPKYEGSGLKRVLKWIEPEGDKLFPVKST